MAESKKRIHVLVGEEYEICRGVLRGVFSYAIPGRPWILTHGHPSHMAPKLDYFRESEGVIVFSSDRKMLDTIAQSGKHVVNTSGSLDDQPFPRVTLDNDAIGRMAARYFMEKGFRKFVCWTAPGSDHNRHRRDSFLKELGSHGHVAEVFYEERNPSGLRDESVARLIPWLRKQDEPVGLFFVDDTEGRAVSQQIYHAGIHVPGEVALLGVDNDLLKCMMAYPPLSSISVPAEKIGYEAAAMLDRLINGRPGGENIALPPIGVVERDSSRTEAVRDEDVARAMRYIRENAQKRISVRDVLGTVDVCRSTLERKFRTTLNRTPLEEIHRAHLEQAKRLLVETDRTLAEVAKESGYRDAAHLIMHFRKRADMTPSEYRKDFLLK